MDSSKFFFKGRAFFLALIVLFSLFIGIMFMKKTENIIGLIPKLRGEVSIGNGFVITHTKDNYPLIIKEDDPFSGQQLRFSGSVKSVFSETVADLCNGNDIIIEVGSYFGYNSVLLGKKLKKGGKIYCFEPNPSIFLCLRKNVIINDLESHCVLKNIAISSASGSCSIEDYFTVSKLKDGSYTKPRMIKVACDTLDEALEDERKAVDILATDVPGIEFLILSGASRILEHDNIKVVFAFDKDASSKNTDVRTELNNLHALGFRFFISKGKKDISPITIDEIMEMKSAVLVLSRKLL
ncbi:hypothetical protein FACS189472_03480 [Alphaproteobacteria bacterium]|nr:hypothetical protein FACS189472_03480 [Alphaproteobacteria bacterium]